MVSGAEFTETVRHGRRIGGQTMVLHVRLPAESSATGLRVGFVVSKAVGNAVTRNRVKRRLRHLVAGRVSGAASFPAAGTRMVIRALPAAAADPDRLVRDFDRAWLKLAGPATS